MKKIHFKIIKILKIYALALVGIVSASTANSELKACELLCEKVFWETASQAQIALEISRVEGNERDLRGNTPLMYLMYYGRSEHLTENIAALLDAGIDVNARDLGGNTALMATSAGQYIEPLKLLLAAGADVSFRNGSEQTALIKTAKWADAQNLQALLDAGADVNAQDEWGITALMLVSSDTYAYRDVKVKLKVLIDAGANVNAQNDDLETALMWAASLGTPENLRALLDAGADVNVRNKYGANAILNAIRDDTSADSVHEKVQLLLKAGADAFASDGEGMTAWSYAQENLAFKGTDAYWMLNAERFK